MTSDITGKDMAELILKAQMADMYRSIVAKVVTKGQQESEAQRQAHAGTPGIGGRSTQAGSGSKSYKSIDDVVDSHTIHD